MTERDAMAKSALPAFHTKAKAQAEALAEEARILQTEADALLTAIDDLLAGPQSAA